MQKDDEAASTRKRGRPAGETPAQRIERLERELQQARTAAKAIERERAVVVGTAVLAEAASDGELKARLADILRRRISSNAAKAQIAELLI